MCLPRELSPFPPRMPESPLPPVLLTDILPHESRNPPPVVPQGDLHNTTHLCCLPLLRRQQIAKTARENRKFTYITSTTSLNTKSTRCYAGAHTAHDFSFDKCPRRNRAKRTEYGTIDEHCELVLQNMLIKGCII